MKNHTIAALWFLLSTSFLLVLTHADLVQVLKQGESLYHNQGIVKFHNDKCGINVQGNGKAVTYVQYKPMWDSGDPRPTVEGNYRLMMQADGNLVIYSESENVVYATHTAGSGGEYFLAFDNDCVLGIYKGKISDSNAELVWKNKIGALKRGQHLKKGQILRFPGTDKFLYVQPSDGHVLVKEGPEGDLRGDEVVLWASNSIANDDTQDYFLKAGRNGHLTAVGINSGGEEYVYWDKDLEVENKDDCYMIGLDGNNEPIALSCQDQSHGNIEQVLGTNEGIFPIEGRKYFHGGQCLVYLQDNGKFVTGRDRGYGNGAHHITWHSGDPRNYTPNNNVKMRMQHDGNLVIRLTGTIRDSKKILFASHTSGEVGDYFLGMSEDCTVAVYKGRITDPSPQVIWKSVRSEFRKGERLGRGEIVRYSNDAFLYIQPSDGHLTVRTGPYLSGSMNVWGAGPLANSNTFDYFLQATNNGHLSLVGIGTDGGSDYEYWNKNLGFQDQECYFVEVNDEYEPIGVAC